MMSCAGKQVIWQVTVNKFETSDWMCLWDLRLMWAQRLEGVGGAERLNMALDKSAGDITQRRVDGMALNS